MARRRRLDLERRQNFTVQWTAQKYVRGDAVAGNLITLINIIWRVVVGVIQKGMPEIEAAKNYTFKR
jgi:flagellar biosynthesis protein FlhA